MRYLWLSVLVMFCAICFPSADAVPQNQSSFNTNATFSVDSKALTLSSAVTILEAPRSPGGYSSLRIHFYSFALTPEDIAGARTGNVESMDRKSNLNSVDPKVLNSSFAIIRLSLDQPDFKVLRVDMTIPGHSCTIAPFEQDVQSFLQTYRYDGKNLRLKSKGSHVCDFKMLGLPNQTFTWDFDLTLPVFEKGIQKM